jgi:hypothetical protein
MAGTALRGAGRAAGLDAGAPADLYAAGSGALPEGPGRRWTSEGGAELAGWLATGEAALRTLAPDQTPVLWPEHFDLAITVNEVNYGISPGDAFLAEPYAYVGPWSLGEGWSPREGGFWNAPFGAVRRAGDLADAGEVAAFFAAGRAATSG